MWPNNTIQKHICVLFISCVFVVSLLSLKHKIHNKTASKTIHEINYNDFNNSKNSSIITSNKSKSWIKFNSYTSAFTKVIEKGAYTETVHILGLFELTTKWGRRMHGESELAAAQLAIKHVNNFNVLPEYTLNLITNDTQCDPGAGIDTFFHAIYSTRTIVMLLGSSCSNVTESLAHVVPYWNILQISFGSTSPTLSDRRKFPLFFRTVAPDSSYNSAKIEFVKHFGWKVVATFHQSENEFLLPLNKLIAQFENENISCTVTNTFSADNYREQLKALKDSDIRIIIGSFSSQLASKIFCEVYKLEMFGADYVWIIQKRILLFDTKASGCTMAELRKSIEGIVLISDYETVSEDDFPISGLRAEMFEKELKVSKEEISPYAAHTYDAVWAMALTLRGVQISYRDFNFSYKRKDIAVEFVRQMSALNFVGMSGPVKFIGADRIGSSLLQQIQDGKMIDIAVYNPHKNRLDFRCKNCKRVKWHNGEIPIAQRILKVTLFEIPKPILYSTISVSIFGIAIALVLLYFNLRFRRMKTVKISSPNLNNVAVIGCILVYIYVILLGFDSSILRSDAHFSDLCTVRVYLLAAGFSLTFGSMFAKTYRVHRIFVSSGSTPKVKDKLLKDKHLIILILIPPIIDGLIFALWVMIDPMERRLYNLSLEISSEDRGVVYQPQVEICRCHNTLGWLTAVFGYKGLILIMGVFMAWETRHVKVPALNDSQYIGICVYSAVFSAIITFLGSLISEFVIISYLARTTSILISMYLTLLLLFLPKLKAALVSHDDAIVLQSMGLKTEHKTRRLIVLDDTKEQNYRLEVQNRVYKCKLDELNSEIAKLERQLLSASSSRAQSCKVFTINFERGSWPETNEILKPRRTDFCSESTLNYRSHNHRHQAKVGFFSRKNRTDLKIKSDPDIACDKLVIGDRSKSISQS